MELGLPTLSDRNPRDFSGGWGGAVCVYITVSLYQTKRQRRQELEFRHWNLRNLCSVMTLKPQRARIKHALYSLATQNHKTSKKKNIYPKKSLAFQTCAMFYIVHHQDLIGSLQSVKLIHWQMCSFTSSVFVNKTCVEAKPSSPNDNLW